MPAAEVLHLGLEVREKKEVTIQRTEYQRVLVVALGRINEADSSSNGLLLRNLFGDWPRERLAQVFSSGDNDDAGFFSGYYKLGPQDRRLGRLFYRLKSLDRTTTGAPTHPAWVDQGGSPGSWAKRLLLESGLYELIFAPRLSREMRAWVEEFRPDVLFAQGYNLTFTWFPLMLSKHLGIPICYYPTDDWTGDLYRLGGGVPCLLSWPARRAVRRSSRELVQRSAVRVAFNSMMQQEYWARYKVPFAVLMHGDDARRFSAATPKRLADPDELWIVSMGAFGRHRWPLLRDLEQACEILAATGRRVRATIFAACLPNEQAVRKEQFRHVEFAPCPSHEDLAALLRGADVLFLPERFDETAQYIRLCVSSKAHLFMFSGTPIVVYSAPEAGVAQYVQRDQWAMLVDRRNPEMLAHAFQDIAEDDRIPESLLLHAQRTTQRNHDLPTIQTRFQEMLSQGVRQPADVL